MAKSKKNAFVIDDIDKIKDFLEGKSESIINLINNNPNDKYLLIYKNLTHSDVITAGKRTGNQDIDKYYLCYLTEDELEKVNERSQQVESAKQSNITIPHEFYNELNMPILERRIGAQTTQHEHPCVNDYAKVYLVNDTMKFFDIDYTKKVFEKLNKNTNWDFEKYKVILSNDVFTEIKLSEAIHGLGTESDVEFHKLRRSMFKNDFIMFLIRTDNNDNKYVYIMLEKNPRFFTILNETNEQWQKYLEKQNQIAMTSATTSKYANNIHEEKTRAQQNKWRNMLAQEMMIYTNVDNEVFCPFTLVEADYYELGTLYRASHIKAFKNCDSREAYDINNGLLLLANADALFDKYLITVGEDKKLIFSFTLKDNYKLINKLLLNQPIFDMILNDQRMEYMKEHRKKFEEAEEKRKSMDNYDINDIYVQESVNEDSDDSYQYEK